MSVSKIDFRLGQRWSRPIMVFALALVAWPVFYEWISSVHTVISGEHMHRQSDTFSVARHFVVTDGNFFYPRVDHSRGGTGVVGMEAPLVPYAISLALRVGGIRDELGRWVVLLLSLPGFLALGFLLVHSLKTKWWVAGMPILLSPMTLYYSRSVQPDVPMIAMGMASVTLLIVHRQQRGIVMFSAALLFGLGMLTKYPLLFAYPAFLVALFDRPFSSNKEKLLAAVWAVLPLCMLASWMMWSAHLNTLNPDGAAYIKATPTAEALWATLKKAEVKRVLGYVVQIFAFTPGAAPLYLFGLALSFRPALRRVALPFQVWLAGALLLAASFTDAFEKHYYYAILFLPPLWLFTCLSLREMGRLLTPEASGSTSIRRRRDMAVAMLGLWAGYIMLVEWKQHDWPQTYLVRGFFVWVLMRGVHAVLRRIWGSSPFIISQTTWMPWAAGTIMFLALTACLESSQSRFHERLTRLGTPEKVANQVAELRDWLQARSKTSDLVVAAVDGGANPWPLHVAQRQGWIQPAKKLKKETLQHLAQNGARWLIVDVEQKRSTQAVLRSMKGFTPVAKGKKWILYDLSVLGYPPEDRTGVPNAEQGAKL